MAGAAPGQTEPPLGAATPAYQPTQGPNVFQQSATGLTNAFNTAGNAASSAGQIRGMTAAPGNVTAQQIAANARAPNVTAQQIAAGQLSNTDLSAYMNPFQSHVIDTTISDLERARQQAMIQMGGQASASGAFGGSRHGVAMGETNRAFDDNTARALAGLNFQNFNNAQQMGQFDIGNRLQADMSNQGSSLSAAQGNQTASLAAQEMNNRARMANQSAALSAAQGNQQSAIQAAQVNAQAAAARAAQMNAAAMTQGNLSNLGFGMGMQLNDQMMAQGALQQLMQQQLIDQGAQQYGGWANSPIESTQGVNAALGALPGGGGSTQTTTSTPGIIEILGGIATLCWVAREVYGVGNPAWLEFRQWMLERAPNWLRKAYIKNGPKWAAWVKRNPWSKRILRPLMDSVKCS